MSCVQLYSATQTLWFQFSTILDTVLQFLVHFVVVFALPPMLPLLNFVQITDLKVNFRGEWILWSEADWIVLIFLGNWENYISIPHFPSNPPSAWAF